MQVCRADVAFVDCADAVGVAAQLIMASLQKQAVKAVDGVL